MNDDRLIGLIAYLHAHHAGGFVNNTITRDELLSVLEELRKRRDQSTASLTSPGASISAARIRDGGAGGAPWRRR